MYMYKESYINKMKKEITKYKSIEISDEKNRISIANACANIRTDFLRNEYFDVYQV